MNAKPELTLEKAKEMPVRDLNNIIKNYSKATEDFQNAYDIQLGNLVTEKTQENENSLQEHNRTKGRVEDITDALKHLEESHGHINENRYKKLLEEIIASYRLLYTEFPEELSDVSDDVTIEELKEIISTFDSSVNEKIDQETEEINSKIKDLSNNYRQKVKENIEKGKERPWEVNLDDLEGDNN
jgi:predicted nuclease with TOPRIM domain